MNAFDGYLKALSREGFWGPFLVLAGIEVFYFASGRITEPRTSDYLIVGAGAFLTVAGVFLMFRKLASGTKFAAMAGPETGQEDADYVVHQLSRNFEILRAQTNQGFVLSGAFRAIGLLIIIASLFAPSLGLKTEGVNNLGVFAGVLTEFISGSALLLYRLNFSRLNQTADRLDDAWRVLAAFKLTRELPDEKKAEATMQLMSSLTQRASPAPQGTREEAARL